MYIRCGMTPASIGGEYTLREAAQGFGDVLCQLKLTRIPRQDSQASLEYSVQKNEDGSWNRAISGSHGGVEAVGEYSTWRIDCSWIGFMINYGKI